MPGVEEIADGLCQLFKAVKNQLQRQVIGILASQRPKIFWNLVVRMKPMSSLILVAGILLVLPGCVLHPVAVSPVGPEPITCDGVTLYGYLQVFSKTISTENIDDIYYYPHSDYAIYDQSGRLLQYVRNQGDGNEMPTLLRLPQGNYTVVAAARNYSQATVPVVIKAGRPTYVYLDRDWKPISGISSNDLVRLPDGQVVGWNASSK